MFKTTARVLVGPLDEAVRHLPLAGAGRLRFEVGVGLARVVRWLDRCTDSRIDTSRSGRALVAAAPDALRRLGARLPEGIVVVSATNGKTTTTKLLVEILRAHGLRVVTSASGANMTPGLVAELVASSRCWGRTIADIGVFEVDELWLDRVLEQVEPRVLVLGSLSRDQLDRTGEVDQVAELWGRLVTELPSATRLVVTADDPRVYQAVAGHPDTVTYGLDPGDPDEPDPGGLDLPTPSDVGDCARCGGSISYAARHIGHQGAWRCASCGRRRPDPVVSARDRSCDLQDGSRFTVETPEGSSPVAIPLPGRFNIVNATAAIAGARALGVPLATCRTALPSVTEPFGRTETVDVDGRPVTVLLAKNPTGLEELVGLLTGERALDLLFILNDHVLDGRDVSWIWDANLERLAPSVSHVVCGGTRASEAAMRWDYAGTPSEAIEVVGDPSAGAALERARKHSNAPLFALCNYTAMLDLRETLAEDGHVGRYWR